MKKLATWMAVGVAMMGTAWAEPEPEGPQVFPGQEDAMLRKLMGEMLKGAEEDRREMEKPVELPKLDAPEMRRLLGKVEERQAPETWWMIGVQLEEDDTNQIVVRLVREGSPASDAGLKKGDVLRTLNGIRLRDGAMLSRLFQVVRDQEVVLGVGRGDADLECRVTAREVEVLPMDGGERNDEVLEELRGMRKLMEEMLRELKKQTPKVRRVPTRPRVPTPPGN